MCRRVNLERAVSALSQLCGRAAIWRARSFDRAFPNEISVMPTPKRECRADVQRDQKIIFRAGGGVFYGVRRLTRFSWMCEYNSHGRAAAAHQRRLGWRRAGEAGLEPLATARHIEADAILITSVSTAMPFLG